MRTFWNGVLPPEELQSSQSSPSRAPTEK